MQALRQPGCKLISSSSRGAQQCLSCVSSRHRLRERTVLPARSSEATGSSPSSSTHASTSSTDAQGSTKPAAAKAAAQPSPAPTAASSSPPPATDWEARRKQRVVNDLVDVSACRQRECTEVNASLFAQHLSLTITTLLLLLLPSLRVHSGLQAAGSSLHTRSHPVR